LIGHYINIKIEEKQDVFIAISAESYTNTQITYQSFPKVVEA